LRDFYGTAAQVLPVLLLALVFESRHLERVGRERRRPRRVDPAQGVRFWTKGRVRAYTLAMSTVVLGDTAACVLVLGDMLADSRPLRTAVITGVLLAAVTLLFRIWVDVIGATSDKNTRHIASDDN
jgi:protein-S-isoprenylcysteine O-methyltransferase Ste14